LNSECTVKNFHVKSLFLQLATVCSVILTVNSQIKSIKITYKTDKNAIFFCHFYWFCLWFYILFVNWPFKQQSIQLSVLKAVISHKKFQLCGSKKRHNKLFPTNQTIDGFFGFQFRFKIGFGIFLVCLICLSSVK
jgi:hypothetical protein